MHCHGDGEIAIKIPFIPFPSRYVTMVFGRAGISRSTGKVVCGAIPARRNAASFDSLRLSHGRAHAGVHPDVTRRPACRAHGPARVSSRRAVRVPCAHLIAATLHGETNAHGGGWIRLATTHDAPLASILARREILANESVKPPQRFLTGRFHVVTEATLRKVLSYLAQRHTL